MGVEVLGGCLFGMFDGGPLVHCDARRTTHGMYRYVRPLERERTVLASLTICREQQGGVSGVVNVAGSITGTSRRVC